MKTFQDEIDKVHPENTDNPDWEAYELAETLVHERHSKAELKNLVHWLLIQRKEAEQLRRYNTDQLQDRCENAYVETSRWDAALQALAEVAPDHPLLKGGHPSYGVWTMMRKQLDASQQAIAACREFVAKCDAGLARSKVSYAKMKAALEAFDKA